MPDNAKITYIALDNVIRKQAESMDKDLDIIAVANGGKIPAAMFSYYCKAKMIGQIHPDELDSTLPNLPTDICFVDEILDSGATFRKIRKCYPDARFAFVYVRNSTWGSLTKDEKDSLMFIPQKIMSDKYLEFPWEV